MAGSLLTCQAWRAIFGVMIQPQDLLRELGPETWGDKLRRARNSRGLTLDQLAALASRIVPVSYGPFNRLERMTAPPSNKKSRMWAGVLVLICGYLPDEFGLSMDDVPTAIRNEAIALSQASQPGPHNPGEQEQPPSWCESPVASVSQIGDRRPHVTLTHRKIA